MKFLAPFYGVEATANARFAEIEDAYDTAVTTVEGQLPDGFSAGYLCIEPDNGCEFMYAHGADSLNGQILETLGATNPFAEGNDAANGQTFDYEYALGRPPTPTSLSTTSSPRPSTPPCPSCTTGSRTSIRSRRQLHRRTTRTATRSADSTCTSRSTS